MNALNYLADRLPFFSNKVRNSNAQDAVKVTGELSWNDNTNATIISNTDDYFPIAISDDVEIHSINFQGITAPITLTQSGLYTINFIAWADVNPIHNITAQVYADDDPISLEFPISGAPPAFGYSHIVGACHRHLQAGKTLRLKVRNRTSATNFIVKKLVAIARKQ